MRELEIINAQFNEELKQQINGTLPKGHVYKLGMPSEALLSRLGKEETEAEIELINLPF